MKLVATLPFVYAICDHFESTTKKPTLSTVLKGNGVTRAQLRKWVSTGRLNEYNVTLPNGQLVKAYSRPKEGSQITLD